MRNYFVESLFCIVLVSKAFLVQKNVEVIENVIACRRKVWRVWRMVKSFISQLNQLFCCHQHAVERCLRVGLRFTFLLVNAG